MLLTANDPDYSLQESKTPFGFNGKKNVFYNDYFKRLFFLT
jgi:hypothetical protein